ncbi:hypothetical protein F5Y18DRAFT_428114 [Xylariaceae sp. FL1019]|nr:hypothetical protein F5Y18DRAFT_428114 [Xylariaceae sp. FL1019]
MSHQATKDPVGSRQSPRRDAKKKASETLEASLKSVWALYKLYRYHERVLREDGKSVEDNKTSYLLKRDLLNRWKELGQEFRSKSRQMKHPFPQWVETHLENHPVSDVDVLLSIVYETKQASLTEKSDNSLEDIMTACKCSVWRLHLYFEHKMLVQVCDADTFRQFFDASPGLPYSVLFEAFYQQAASRRSERLAGVQRENVTRTDVRGTTTKAIQDCLRIFQAEKKVRDDQRHVITTPPPNVNHEDCQEQIKSVDQDVPDGSIEESQSKTSDREESTVSTVFDDLGQPTGLDKLLARVGLLKEQVSAMIVVKIIASEEERQLSLVLKGKKRERDEAWETFSTWTGDADAKDGVQWDAINSNLDSLKDKDASVKHAVEELEESQAKRRCLEERMKPHEDQLDQVMSIMREIEGAVKASKE